MNLLSDFEFFFDGAETLFLDRDATSDEVAKGTYKGKKADRFEVPTWNDTQAN